MDSLRKMFAVAFPVPDQPSAAVQRALTKVRVAAAFAFALRTFMFAILLGGFTLVCLWSTDRTPPVIVLASHMTTPVKAGQRVRQTVSVARLRACRTLVEREIVDSIGTHFPLPDEDAEIYGAVGDELPPFSRLFDVDRDAAAGTAYLVTTVTWHCNPLQRLWPIVARRPPRAFEIMREPDHGR